MKEVSNSNKPGRRKGTQAIKDQRSMLPCWVTRYEVSLKTGSKSDSRPCGRPARPAAGCRHACRSSPCWRAKRLLCRRRVRSWCPEIPVSFERWENDHLFLVSTHLGPSSVAFLDDLSDSPALGLFPLQHVLDHHGRGEGRGDVEDLEVAEIARSALSDYFDMAVGVMQLTKTCPCAYPPRPWKTC